MKYFKRVLIIFLMLSNCSMLGLSSTQDSNSIATTAVKEFCNWEFEASFDMDKRESLVYYTNKVKREKHRPKWLNIYYVEWRSDPRKIISSYKIEAIRISGSVGTATIKYHILGNSLKHDIFTLENPHDETVTLKLKEIAGRWKVVDPGQLYVSKKATLSLAKEDLESIEKLMKDPKNIPYHSENLVRKRLAVETIEKMAE